MPSQKTLPYYFYATDAVGSAHWINLSCAHRIAMTHPSGSPQEQGFTIYFQGDEEIHVIVPEQIAELTKRLDGAAKARKLRIDKPIPVKAVGRKKKR